MAQPGRFLESGSQQRFIHAMRTTKLVADDPAFSFDRRPSRNARAYGPELMRHLYTTFGIFDVIGRFVLLSNSPLTWCRQGDFDRVTRPMELDTVDLAAIKSRGSPGGRPVCTQAGLRVTHVNTLPLAQSTVSPARMPQGAGLLLTLSTCPTAGPVYPVCANLGLLSKRRGFAIGRRNGSGPVSAISPRHLVDTSAMPAGIYDLVLIHDTDCIVQKGGHAPANRVESTGVVLALETGRE